MTEDDARQWITEGFGSHPVTQLEQLAGAIIDENSRQNLIAPSTIPHIWSRHLLDSAQLIPLADTEGTWLDIGSGGGLPGLAVAVLRQEQTVLVEPRRQRAEFLQRCASMLRLENVSVRQVRVEALAIPSTVISARAVASVEKLLQAGAGCSSKATRWLLPRGRFDASDLQRIRMGWKGMFHMKQSLTDPASTILICDGPERR